MLISEQQIMAMVGDYIWPLLRISAAFITIPVFSARYMPNRVRIGLVLAITGFATPLIPEIPVIEILSYEGLITGLQQLLIGLLMGFVLQLVFSAVIFAGQAIAYSMGLGFASMLDPGTGVSVPMISQFYLVLSTLLFLVLGGHLVLIQMLMDSFTTLPIGMEGVGRVDLWSVIAWSSRLFSAGLLMAMPAMTALLMVNVAFGVVTKAAPQLNIFAVGFPITLLLGLLLMWVTLPSVLNNFSGLLNESYTVISSILRIKI